MKLTLMKHGGFAAGLRRPPQVVDAHTLSKAAATELTPLVAAAQAAPGTAEGGPGRARDAMSYTITVEDGGRQAELCQSDVTMSPAFAALLDWIERHAPGD